MGERTLMLSLTTLFKLLFYFTVCQRNPVSLQTFKVLSHFFISPLISDNLCAFFVSERQDLETNEKSIFQSSRYRQVSGD